MRPGYGLRPALAGMLMAAFTLSFAQAEDFPSRPITLVVPLGAGGAMDILARTFGPKLSERLGKPVIVENRTGGGTVIAAQSVAKAAPDGYTLLIAPSGTLTTNVALYKKLSYDPKDFVPLVLYAKVPFVLVVTPSLPIRTVADLIAYAKEKPGQLSYASTGTGAAPHLAGELLKTIAGINLVHVPYKGGPPALNDVIGGHVHLFFADPAISPPLIQDGKVRALGVTSLSRVGVLPEVPPLAETGLSGFEAVSWHMIVAPAGTPPEVVTRLRNELKAVIALPEVQAEITKIGLIPVDSPPVDELKHFLDSEIVRWGQLVQQVGIAGSQ
jgi:tripartite-type tricarboxylate transporter receptor subunit TctC